MSVKTLHDACVPRESVFDPAVRDTVYDIDDLDKLDPRRFFEENYVTAGMRQLLTEAFSRLEGKSQSASGIFLLSQAMGGGKTHNLLALGLLARNPALRQEVMGGFYQPGPLGAVRVVTFSGRRTNLPYGLWGEIADQLDRREIFKDFYAPLRAPGKDDWIKLLRGDPVLILLDELPPYFEQAQAIEIGNTTLDVVTTAALANLLVAISSGHLPNACIVLTDLSASAYGMGSQRMSQALHDLENEANRTAHRIEPVQLNTDELYHIMRTRLFKSLPTEQEIEAVAHAFAMAVDEALKTDQTTASPQAFRDAILRSYPFHPAIRDLYARFKENPGFQQTRALLRLMRRVVALLWQSGGARARYLIGAHDLDLRDPDIMSEIRQINGSFDSAIAHDIASSTGTAVAELIDAELGGSGATDAQDAAKLLLLSSLSRAVNPTLGLDRSTVVAYLAAPGRSLGALRKALDDLLARAWYLHVTAGGVLLFKNVENLNAKLESYALGMVGEMREAELRGRLQELFKPKINDCYQEIAALPALDHVEPAQDRITLVIFRPAPDALGEIRNFWEHQQFKNRLLFLSGSETGYQRVLQRSAYLRAVNQIIAELDRENVRANDPQYQDALAIRSREEANFYIACRETFQTIYYPSRAGLTERDLDPQYAANRYDGEEQIRQALISVFKFDPNVLEDPEAFGKRVEDRLWPAESNVASWAEIKRRAAADPSWIWHHPRALDDLKETMLRRDRWRDAGSGFIERGPFPKPATSVQVQELSRDSKTGQVTLRVRPLHGDRVHYAEGRAVSEDSPVLDGNQLTTDALEMAFLAVDSKGEHETGEPALWRNKIEVKYRLFRADELMMELKAVPRGEIRYTVDGSSPLTSGLHYEGPFVIPAGTRVVRAMASANGISSEIEQFDIPEETGDGPIKLIDPHRPASWRPASRLHYDATGETYTFLGVAERHHALLSGVELAAQRGKDWLSLTAGDETLRLNPAWVREEAERLQAVLPGANVTLDVDVLHFERGQDLFDLVEECRMTLNEDDVTQPA